MPGKEFKVRPKDGRAARLQLDTIAACVPYAVFDGRAKDDTTSKDADGYFASFKLSDEARKAHAEIKR